MVGDQRIIKTTRDKEEQLKGKTLIAEKTRTLLMVERAKAITEIKTTLVVKVKGLVETTEVAAAGVRTMLKFMLILMKAKVMAKATSHKRTRLRSRPLLYRKRKRKWLLLKALALIELSQ